MAKKDAIFDYSSDFDTSPYLIGIGKDWDNLLGSTKIPRFDFLWRGTPRAEDHIHGASSSAAISGWDVGTWKSLSMYDLPLQDYSAYDPLVSNKQGFVSRTHQLISIGQYFDRSANLHYNHFQLHIQDMTFSEQN